MDLHNLAKEYEPKQESQIEFEKVDYIKLGDKTEINLEGEIGVRNFPWYDFKNKDENGNPTEKPRYLVYAKNEENKPYLLSGGVYKDLLLFMKENPKLKKVVIRSNKKEGSERRYNVSED